MNQEPNPNDTIPSPPPLANGKEEPKKGRASNAKVDLSFLAPLRPRKEPEARSFAAVARAMQRHRTRGLVFDHLAKHAWSVFCETEVGAPKYVLRVPGSGTFPAETHDIMEIIAELRQRSDDEGMRVGELLCASVQVDPELVDHRPPPSRVGIPRPSSEGVEVNPAHLAGRKGSQEK